MRNTWLLSLAPSALGWMAQDVGAGEECGEALNAVIATVHRTYRWPPFCLLAGFIFRVGVFSHELNCLFFNFSSACYGDNR